MFDEGGVVDVDEETNEELAVHAIGDATVTGDELVEVLLLKGAFHGGGEETAEGSNDGREECNDDGVELHGHDGELANEGGSGRGEIKREGHWREEGVDWASACVQGQLAGTATEPIERSQEASAKEGHHYRNDCCPEKSLPCLVWR